MAGRRGALQIQKREPIKSLRILSNFTKQSWMDITKEDIVLIKHMQSNKMNVIQHAA